MPKIICNGAQNKGFGADAVTAGMQIGKMTMPRYIDADKLDEIVQDLNKHYEVPITRYEYKRISGVLCEFPTADVVEVVRCKDCVHWKRRNLDDKHYCDVFDWVNEGNDYCSFAERRDDGKVH